MKYTCPCCGYRTLNEEPPGTYDICRICFWEDDNVQFDDPEYEGGANTFSLRQCQQNFLEYGACDERCLSFVRSPSYGEERDPEWKPLPAKGEVRLSRPGSKAKEIFHLPGSA